MRKHAYPDPVLCDPEIGTLCGLVRGGRRLVENESDVWYGGKRVSQKFSSESQGRQKKLKPTE